MERIHLQGVLPNIFIQQPLKGSEVWERDIVFSKGELVLIEAASGRGKTSLCSYIYGYRNDYKGHILFDDNDLSGISSVQWGDIRRNALGMLFQGLRLFPELTALENIQLKNRLTGYKSDEWIRNAFERLGIAEKVDSPVTKISFGQQQRVALIRTLCQPLDFILLDEPVSHIDEVNSRHTTELLLEEVKQQGCGVITTSIGKHLQLPYTKIMQL